MTTPVLEVDVSQRLGDLALNARFVSDGPVTALFGRSGAGKTSLLNLIAGLSQPDIGRIVFDGQILTDTGTRLSLPAHKRRFGTVFQDARLFPHLTVRQNLMFGGWFRDRGTARREFEPIVDLLGLAPLLRRWPASLSGGEKQRVAIGRALLAQPRLLLMDEPLSSLDGARKDEIMAYIERIKAEMRLPIIYVTHSVPEIIRLASHVAVVENGAVRDFGSLGEMLARIGPDAGQSFGEPSALLDATVSETDPEFGMVRLTTAFGQLDSVQSRLKAGQTVRVRILASDVMLAVRRPDSISARNIIAAEIADIQTVPDGLGSRVDIRLVAQSAAIIARITAKAVHMLDLRIGMPVFAVIKSVAIEH